ncbi:SGNH/GDSL hydrolase family protein [Brunnivagina elsteri]|uniref:Lipolytic protein G-D-S-L family n=1 Tax=Brunnivagina elsteri CCALA 953 TaxID=987040 RepID=A0A2A2TGQ2_9CYAN|nr:SGNH/GDSL hydrolase family protein [Calothrix elsteri]PAX52808.1 lipolytic protein G-D-S-L family [Calothrix elsteri CCALA 953]
MKIALLIILAVVFGATIVIELVLRSRYGFGSPLIYIGDSEIGYLLAPNQKTRRNGKRIEINEYSMRSSQIEKIPPSSTLRILLLGDSIANGGWWTDQKETISSLMMESLTNTYINSSVNTLKHEKIEVLNASANSWGPRNELAYLQRFGTFSAQGIVLLINTDDLFATKPISLPVGRDKNYPDRTPFLNLALIEVYQRYLQKSPSIPELAEIQKESGDRIGVNLEAISKIHAIANQDHIQFLLVMTPLKRELGNNSRDYEIKARQRLMEFTKTQGITYVDFLPLFDAHQDPKTLYHDHIHLNLQGNKFVNVVIEENLLKLLQNK